MALVGNGVPGAIAGLLTFTLVNHLLSRCRWRSPRIGRIGRVIVAMGPLGIVHIAGTASVGLLAGWLAIEGTGRPVRPDRPGRHAVVVLPAADPRVPPRLSCTPSWPRASSDSAARPTTPLRSSRSPPPGCSAPQRVEMLLRHPDGLLRYVGDETGVAARVRVEPDAWDGPWALRALAARGVLVGQDGDQPYCSAVLGDPERPLAVFIAHRPSKSPTFTRADGQLAGVLVRQAESWLSVAELSAKRDEAVGRAEAYGAANRVLGDISQETVPALAVLRESAHRLSRLATRFEGPAAVDEIVAELYSVERAVASLLGAIALASDADVDRPALTSGPSAPVRTDAEWTTTGRLEDAVGP